MTDYPAGYFTELVRKHHFPPMYQPKPWSEKYISPALAKQRAENLAKGCIHPKGSK
jgi:hypothetical protein